MKLKSLIFGVLAATAIFCGCQKQEEPVAEAKMTITPETMTFVTAPTEGQTVTVNSTRDWKVTDVPEWITLTVNGKDIKGLVQTQGEIKVLVTAAENKETKRSAQIVFNGGSIANKTLAIEQEGKPVVYNTIAEAKALLGTQSTVTLPDGFIVKATVVSNKDLENQTSSKNVIIQDATGGTAARLNENSTFGFGDVVIVDLSGQVLTKYNGAYQLSNIPSTIFTVESAGTTVEPIKANITDFLANKYESQYIALDDVQVADSDLSKTWSTSSSHTSINMVAKTGEGFVVFSSKYSTFASQTVAQGSGTLKGVSTINNSTIQIMFGQETDWAGLTGERFKIETKTLTIAEVFAKGSGSIATAGRVLLLGPQGFILNDGGDKNLYVFTQSTPSVKIDDFVDVTGELTTYGGVTEVKNPTVTVSSKTFPTPAEQIPVDLTNPSSVTSYTGDKSSQFIKIAGKLVKSGSYYNLEMDGLSIKGSISTTNTEALDAFAGKQIIATGFFIGKTNNYITVIPADIRENTEPYLNVTPAKQEVKSTDTTATVKINTNVAAYSIEISEGGHFTELYGVITAKFPVNETSESKTYTITVKSNGLPDAVATITQKAAGAAEYVLQFTKNSNTAYASTFDVTIDNLKWNAPGNQGLDADATYGGKIKIGGKLSEATDRVIYSKDPVGGALNKITFRHGSGDAAITVNSLKISSYASAADAASGTNALDTQDVQYKDSDETSINVSGSNWDSRYIRIVYNLSSTAPSSNKGVILFYVKFAY